MNISIHRRSVSGVLPPEHKNSKQARVPGGQCFAVLCRLLVLIGAIAGWQVPLQAQQTWKSTSPFLPVAQGLMFGAVAYGGGTYAAVGEYGSVVVTSSDGVSWTSHSGLTSSGFLSAVTYGAGRFVTVGYAGGILTSEDGSVWNVQTISSGSLFTFYGVTYGAGLFVAVGSDNKNPAQAWTAIFTSPDGKVWTPRATTMNGLSHIAYNGTRFVAINNSGTLVSSDGITWTQGSIGAAAFGGAWINAVTAANGLFVAVGEDNYVATSSDGVAWTQRVVPASTSKFQLHGVTTTPAGFIAVGFEAAIDYGFYDTIPIDSVVLVSADGITWTRRQAGLVSLLYGVVYGGGQAIVVGGGGTVLASNDLTTFRIRATSTVLYGAAYGASRFVAVGQNGFTLTSFDGLNWSAQTDGTGRVLRSIAYGAGQFIAVGTPTPLADGSLILTSTDGQTWSPRSAAVSSYLRAVTYGGGIFAAVGEGGVITTSSDGTTWVARNSGTTTRLRGVSYGASKFVVVGDSGVLCISSDGVTWVSMNSGTSAQLAAVTYAANRFVAVGANGIVLTSTDGTTWTTQNSGSSQQLWNVGYSNNTFIAVGAAGVILTSPDAISWTAPVSGGGNDLFAVTAGAGVVVAAGNVGTLISSLTLSGAPSRIINLSILTPLAAGETMTMGTVLGGSGTSGTKPLLARAAGPSLAQFGITAFLPNPAMTLNSTSVSPAVVVATNTKWGGAATLSTAFAAVGAFPYTGATSNDSALFQPSLQPGNYTVQVSDASGGSGTVIAELYDANGAAYTLATPRLINVSVLKQIATGTSLTVGFVIGGSTAKTVLIRAVGPRLGLAPFNIPGVIPAPTMTLVNTTTGATVATNSGWGGDAAITQAATNVGAFAVTDPASKDAMLLVTLAPANYTAQVGPASGTAGGTVIVEVYEVP